MKGDGDVALAARTLHIVAARMRISHLLPALLVTAACGNAADSRAPAPPAPPAPAVARASAYADLRADVNRNGTIDLDDPSEDEGEESWDLRHGAIFLANLDDDASRCPRTGDDAVLARCNDAEDEVVNGSRDLLDLARLTVKPWPAAPEGATGRIALDARGAPHVRLFVELDGAFTVFDPVRDRLDVAALRAGAQLAIEAKDVVRDADVWDGMVDVALEVEAEGALPARDVVRLKVAPLVVPSHLDAPELVYASSVIRDENGSRAFRDDLGAAASAAGLPPLRTFELDDPWAQDLFEPATATMPAPGGAHGMHVNLRSPNFTARRGKGGATLREAGRIVFQMRGPDVGVVVAYDPDHPDAMDTLNSFGNLETVPPYTKGAARYPLGRLLRGRTERFYGDRVFGKLVEAQGVQPPIDLDTSWLLVAHVDEVVSFVPTDSPRGWALVVADPREGRALFEDARAKGLGDAELFRDLSWLGEADELPATTTVAKVLDDPDIAAMTQRAAAKMEQLVATLKDELGLTDGEIVRVPVVFHDEYGGAVAYTPGLVNGVSLGRHFGAPRPHGFRVDGADLFERLTEERLGAVGVRVHWIENWSLYHRLGGEVHCGSNTRRAISPLGFWAAGPFGGGAP